MQSFVLPFATAIAFALAVGLFLRSSWYANYWKRRGGDYLALQRFQRNALGFYVFAAFVAVVLVVKLVS